MGHSRGDSVLRAQSQRKSCGLTGLLEGTWAEAIGSGPHERVRVRGDRSPVVWWKPKGRGSRLFSCGSSSSGLLISRSPDEGE